VLHLSGLTDDRTVMTFINRSNALTTSGLSRLAALGIVGAALLPAAGHAGSQTYQMTFSSPEGGRYCGTGEFVLAAPPAASGIQVFSNDGRPGAGVLRSLSFDVGGIKAAPTSTFAVTFDGPAVTSIHFSSDPLSARRLASSGADLSYEVYNRLNEELAAGTIQVTAIATPSATAQVSGATQTAVK